MTVLKYLDASTAHLTREESAALGDNFGDIEQGTPRVIAHDYGWWLNVPEPGLYDPAAAVRKHYPNLSGVIDHARAHDCAWINFDQDADTIGDLPTHEW